MDADSVITLLDLAPHPEGGFYRETFADPTSTAIYFLLTAERPSEWHRVHGCAEAWHFYAGSALELDIGGQDDEPTTWTTFRLGIDLASGERPQAVVSSGAWQRARSTGEWSLVGCTVAPPFRFDAFEMLT
jgi:uncharacterized protein